MADPFLIPWLNSDPQNPASEPLAGFPLGFLKLVFLERVQISVAALFLYTVSARLTSKPRSARTQLPSAPPTQNAMLTDSLKALFSFCSK